jgi:L,D-transpeptidase ErfK/SrfK
MTVNRVRFVAACLMTALAVAVAAFGGERIGGRLVGGAWTHAVESGESWRSVASRFGVDPQVIADRNALNVDEPLRIGQVLRIDNRHIVPEASAPKWIVVNVPQRMLFFADEAGRVTGLPIAAGRSTWHTPTGPFTILTKVRDPSWQVPASIQEEARRLGRPLPAVVPAGPDNPLGRFWLGLSIPNVGIHGTNAPSSIYRLATHGCMRLHPDDIEWLFDRVDVGWPGEIIYEPVLLAAIDDDVFIEAHPDGYRREEGDVRQQLRERAAALGLTDRIDWTVADRELRRRSGIARRVTRTDQAD